MFVFCVTKLLNLVLNCAGRARVCVQSSYDCPIWRACFRYPGSLISDVNGACRSVCGGVAAETNVGVGSLSACAAKCADYLCSVLSPGRKGDLAWEGEAGAQVGAGTQMLLGGRCRGLFCSSRPFPHKATSLWSPEWVDPEEGGVSFAYPPPLQR